MTAKLLQSLTLICAPLKTKVYGVEIGKDNTARIRSQRCLVASQRCGFNTSHVLLYYKSNKELFLKSMDSRSSPFKIKFLH